jgi:hypothetical protein
MRITVPSIPCKGMVCRMAGAAGRLARRSHRDQSGTITILSVFAVLLLTILLGMLMNVGRQVDGKLRLQNATDAAAYSGGLVLVRGLNSLAFTNRLLTEIFAMTAFMREAHDRHCERYVPDILAAWNAEVPVLATSGFPKFVALGPAIAEKTPLEWKLVQAFGGWAAAIADGPPDNPDAGALPLMETVLREHLITGYQRALVAAIPDMAQHATMTVATLNGQPDYGRGLMSSVLWRTNGQPVDGSYLVSLVVDPNGDADSPAPPELVSQAAQQRNWIAQECLAEWNARCLAFFNYGAKMSQFAELWRGFSVGQLQSLLKEYVDVNLPLVIRNELSAGGTLDYYETEMNDNFTFLAVTYWGKVPELAAGLYHSPIESDALGFAQLRIFVPASRLTWHKSQPSTPPIPMGGPPGYQWPPDPSSSSGPATWFPDRQAGVITDWNLWNQHWTCQLVPAAHPIVTTILQTPPPIAAPGQNPITTPNLSGVSPMDLEQISQH